ncbi:MAG: class I SAM-dependent methyltransferase [Vicinamibacterales bacterium]
MTTTAHHYEEHLGPVYLWMAGGADTALAAGLAELQALDVPMGAGTHALDLGAGFGMHAIPLARMGADVIAIDSSPLLLRELDTLRGDTPVRTACDDLLAFPRHVIDPPDLILCMGDTLTHLPDVAAVETLLGAVASALAPRGRFVATFRDYSTALEGDRRFIPVRSDEARVLTCFLEYAEAHVTVHDLLHERTPEGWTMRVSHYRKLRLDVPRLVARMEAAGLDVRRDAGPRGMVRLVATRR